MQESLEQQDQEQLARPRLQEMVGGERIGQNTGLLDTRTTAELLKTLLFKRIVTCSTPSSRKSQVTGLQTTRLLVAARAVTSSRIGVQPNLQMYSNECILA